MAAQSFTSRVGSVRRGALGYRLLAFSSVALATPLALGQTVAPAPSTTPTHGATPIGHTSAKEVQVSGAVDIHNGEMQLGNGSTITAGDQSVRIALTRGGDLRLCSTTSVHLSRDRTIDAPDSTALMMALDRGAIEADYTVGKYSDVLLTPDLRILISGPGRADLRIRVNGKGDTCVDNRGPDAPYITITSQLEGGLYRVQPNQHVTFEHGSLREVVDTETAPCGCPPSAPVSIADSGAPSATAARPGKTVGDTPFAGPKDTEFPLAVSEGLAVPPLPPTTPVAAPGEVHAQVVVPFVFNGTGGAATGTASPAAPAATAPSKATPTPPSPAPVAHSAPVATPSHKTDLAEAPPTPKATEPSASKTKTTKPRTLLRKVGHFFSTLFGAE